MTNKESQQIKAKQYKEKLKGHFFRHFKGGLYYVESVGVHSETDELMVVYQSISQTVGGISCTGNIWVRPLSMFLSEVDHNKYPDVTQKMRFEMVG